MDELFHSEEFSELIRRLEKVAANYEQDLITATTNSSFEDIRWKSGRVTGLRIAVNMLTKAKEHG